MNAISLSELTNQIQETIRYSFDTPVWICAEISEFRENQNGHCYLELVEKDEQTDQLLAKTKATIWASTYRMLKPYFESSTGESLKSGIKIRIAVSVEFSGVYGFSLNVRDIDPTYTLGELAARRLKIIRQLEQDGVMDMNKQLDLADLPRRLAIISSPTAAGLGDFMDQLQNNSHQYRFHIKLFPAIMQGELAENSIISALDKIYVNVDLFDAVVLIRGGGATTDLACFDGYDLAVNCAQFPLPILAGIGHQRDNSIVDMVAYASFKTPTAVAEYLIQKYRIAENEVNNIFIQIAGFATQIIHDSNQKLTDIQWRIKNSMMNRIMYRQSELSSLNAKLSSNVRMYRLNQQNKLTILEKEIDSYNPEKMLKHGFTLTTKNGNRISSASELIEGDQIRTWFQQGNVSSVVEKIDK